MMNVARNERHMMNVARNDSMYDSLFLVFLAVTAILTVTTMFPRPDLGRGFKRVGLTYPPVAGLRRY
eukprot:357218-Chlamydomonas_euryale.AAC.26